MVEVKLYEYCDEIDSLIDQGAFDAAISHCRHILKIHPKYLKVYSLLGKAALEKGDLEAAADLFSRVLSMDPEDFVARVGMSIASDKDGSLDQAIWHMERAFELAPDNQAIVGELSRLYGRRDGVEPRKVQLTQGALARLHARGNLYTQAINEQRRLLQTEPERVDLQVALAETLWRADRRIEAAEVSLTILENLPYCLKGNLILGEIWSSSGREIEGTAHLERAQMIDPENEVLHDLFGERSPLPRVEVRIGRMEYVSPPAPAEQEPDWLQTLVEEGGSTTSTDDAVPDWLQAVAASAAIKAMSPGEDAAPESEQVPDWLQDVAATADVDAEEFVSAPETLAPSESEMPDWLAQLTTEPQAAADETLVPEGFSERIEETPGAVAEEGVPGPDEVADWLDTMVSDEEKISAMEPGQAELSTAEQAVAEPDDLPDWLAEIGPAAAGLAAAGLAAAGLAAATEDESEPTEADLLGPEEAELAPDEIPDWLAEMAPSGVDASTDVSVDAALAEEVELEPAEVPDWLAEMAPTDVDAPTEESASAEPGPSAIPDWLREAETGAAEETAEEPGDVPDWLAEIEPAKVEIATAGLAAVTGNESEPMEAEDSELAPGEIPDWLAEMASTVEGAPDAVKFDDVELSEETGLEPGEIPDWLAEMAPTDVGAPAEALPFETEVERGEIPDWLAEMAPAEEDALAGPEFEAEAAEAIVFGEELVAEKPETAPPALVAAETPDWLAALVIAAGATMDEETPQADLTVEPEEETLPEWLAELEKTPDALDLGEATAVIAGDDLGILEGEPLDYAQEEEEKALDPEAELMARMEEMSPEDAFAAWEAMLAESEEELVEEAAPAPEEVEKALDAEAELMARMEELPPEEASAAWGAVLAESELEEATSEPETLQIESLESPGLVVIEEPDKETLVYPEGAGGEVTDAEAELMAQMEEMSPEEAFAAWEAMLAASEEPEPEDAAPVPEEVVVPSVEVGEADLDADTELMARLEEMSPEEAFAAWETMLAEDKTLVPEEAAPTPEEAVVLLEEEEEVQDADAELLARLEEMSPDEAFAAWETTLADSDDLLLEEEAPSVEAVAEDEEAWMALDEDEVVEATGVEITEVQAGLPAEEVEQQLPGTLATDLDQAWMTLAEDESPEEIPAFPISEEESMVTGIEAVERVEEQELEIEIPPWATAEAVETMEEVPPTSEQEIRMGPDLVLLTAEEEVEIKLPQEAEAKLPQEPEFTAPVDVGEPVPDTAQPAEEKVAAFAAAEAVASSDLEDKAEAVEQPAWVAMEEVPASEALIEDIPRVEEKVTEPDSDQARLDLARELWTAGQTADARAEYERLLRSTMRGDVTTDLEKLASDKSADEPTLRLLGDAYMKQDRLPEALEAYRRALASL